MLNFADFIKKKNIYISKVALILSCCVKAASFYLFLLMKNHLFANAVST